MSNPPSTRFGAYLHAALRDEWDGLERINRDLRLADFFTILNALMGLGALLLASGANGGSKYPVWAIHLVLAGIILDGVDGAVARLGKGGGPLGAVLDTLADSCTFVAAPVVITFFWLDKADSTWQLIAYLLPLGLYFTCGLLRLARFESLRDDGKTRYYFSGIPTPAGGMTLLAMILVDIPAPWILALTFYIALLMVSRIRFPKLRGWWAVASGTILLAVLVTPRTPELQQGLTWALLVLMTLYVVVGPFYVLTRFGPATVQQPETTGTV